MGMMSVCRADLSHLPLPELGTEMQLFWVPQYCEPDINVQGKVGGGGGEKISAPCTDPQMTKPVEVTELSVDQVSVWPALIATSFGPVVPRYCIPPMVT